MSGKNATTESDHRIPTGKEKRKGKEAGPVVVAAVVTVAALVVAAVAVVKKKGPTLPLSLSSVDAGVIFVEFPQFSSPIKDVVIHEPIPSLITRRPKREKEKKALGYS